jgi:hypothetical protein
MSSRITNAVLAVLFAAPVVALAVRAFPAAWPARPIAPVTPTTAVWRVVCPPNRDGWQGPYSNPDDCRTALRWAQGACHQPILNNAPNPSFLRYEETCRAAYDATACRCEYLVVAAR